MHVKICRILMLHILPILPWAWRKGEGEGTHMSTSQTEEGRTELWVLTWWGKNLYDDLTWCQP